MVSTIANKGISAKIETPGIVGEGAGVAVLFQFFRLKKGKDSFTWFFYGRFLSINRARTIATTMTKTNKPAIAGTKYMSAADVIGICVGSGVAAA